MKSKAYLDFLSSKPCIVTGSTENVDLHHLIGWSEYRKGSKAPDFIAVPLDHDIHLNELHAGGNEPKFFEKYGINPLREVLRYNLEFLEINALESDFLSKDVLRQLIEVNKVLGDLMEAYAEKEGIEL